MERGVRPSPQVFSRGYSLFSATTTEWPRRASQKAAADPAGPPPTTTTSGELDMEKGGYRDDFGSNGGPEQRLLAARARGYGTTG